MLEEAMVMDQQRVAKSPRVFVGLKIAPTIAQELAQYAHHFERAPSRFVPRDDIHLTLVPPWNENSVPEAIGKLRATSSRLAPFPLALTRLSYWPNHRRARLLCVECAPSGELAALQSALLNAFGQTNDRPFKPHVTLARLKRGVKAASAKSALDQDLALAQSIDAVDLFQSPKPPAKGYTILASVPLSAGQSGNGSDPVPSPSSASEKDRGNLRPKGF
jgi:2'-5' RNA ligase